MTDRPVSDRPVILLVTRDAPARALVAAELARRYDADYEVLPLGDAREAARALETLDTQGRTAALLLADDHAPLESGATVFTVARRYFPDVRRGLLVEWGAWADRDTSQVVLNLMAMGQIDYYVIRPWRSPDEYFHRTVTEFLLEWERAVGGRPREVTIVADPRSARAHDLRSLLARGGVPHAFTDSRSPEGRAALESAGVPGTTDPVVLLHDGRVLVNPTNAQVAAAYGMSTELPSRDEVDLVVVGGGPAGLAAAVYAASEGLSTLVVEGDAIGGQAGSSSLIRNYLGFSRGISGAELAQRAYQQAWVFGAQFATTREAVSLEPVGDALVLTVSPQAQVRARAVVLATGVSYRRLGVPELEALGGAGVFYGASAFEAKALEGLVAHVVGGGNSAGQAALHLARYARRVTLLVRGGTLAESMSAYLIDQLDAAGVQVRLHVEVVGGGGDGQLDSIVVRDRTTGAEETEPSDALFVLIGASPRTAWLPEQVLRDQWGYLLTGEDVLAEGGRRAWPLDRPPQPLETSLPGVFAAGDVRRRAVKRVASAVGEGSVVVSQVHAHLAALRSREQPAVPRP